jgi:pyruvate/2-oxoglutarate dehydrogenase complex dihydrolipoamide dehydrogenase (E3) component
MTNRLTPDICVIGGGSGGLSVAAAAAAFGVDVVLIEKGKMGGDCLNYGCVPSKAMIAAGKHAHAIAEAPQFGVTAGEAKVDFRKVHDHVHSVIGAIAPNDSVERFRAMGVNVIEAAAHFTDKSTVMAGDIEIRARRFVVATGSSAFVPPIPGLDTVEYLTNETLFERTRAPRHLIVIGGGPIGMEMAQAHRRLGAEVTVIEGLRALGKDDPELAAIVLDNIRAEGVVILEGSKVTSVERRGKTGVRVNYESDRGTGHVDGSDLLVAAAASPMSKASVSTRPGSSMTAAASRSAPICAVPTAVSMPLAMWPAGCSSPMSRAIMPAWWCSRSCSALPAKENRDIIPWATYTDPELAHVGLTEEEAARRHGGRISVLRWPYAENDRAQAERKTQG